MLRLSARILAVLVCVAWSVPLIGGLVGGDEHEVDDAAVWEGVVLAVLVLTSIACTVGAFVASGRWAAAVVACGLTLSVFALLTAGRYHWLAVLVAGVPWLAVGTLFLLADRAEADRGG